MRVDWTGRRRAPRRLIPPSPHARGLDTKGLRSFPSSHTCGCGILRIRVRRPLRVLGRLVLIPGDPLSKACNPSMITVLLSISPSPANIQAHMRVDWTSSKVAPASFFSPSPHARGLDSPHQNSRRLSNPKPACAWAGLVESPLDRTVHPQAHMRVGWTASGLRLPESHAPSPHARGLDPCRPLCHAESYPKPACAWAGRGTKGNELSC